LSLFLSAQKFSIASPEVVKDIVWIAATAPLGAIIDLNFREYPRIGEADVALIEADVSGQYVGIILVHANRTGISHAGTPCPSGH
jgi:hypothetical protein